MRMANRTKSICFDFLKGDCTRDNCKFSHDKEAYLANKPKALPGRCPYSNQPRCPYGAPLCPTRAVSVMVHFCLRSPWCTAEPRAASTPCPALDPTLSRLLSTA